MSNQIYDEPHETAFGKTVHQLSVDEIECEEKVDANNQRNLENINKKR